MSVEVFFNLYLFGPPRRVALHLFRADDKNMLRSDVETETTDFEKKL